MSRCPSSLCNYQPCSQSQKMSIGIVVESVPKRRFGSMKETDGEYSRGVKASHTGIMYKNDAQGGFVRVSAPSHAANVLMKNSDYIETQAFIANPCVGKKTNVDSVSEKENKRASEIFSCAPERQVCLPTEMENKSKEVLRMKLREILGTVPSCNDILGNSRTCEVTSTEIIKEQSVKGDAHFKPRQNSDTIETDSENVDTTAMKPVTLSLARRRAPARLRPRNSKPKSLSSDKAKHQGGDIFSFAEQAGSSQPFTVKQGISLIEENDLAKRSYGIKPGDMLSPVTDLKIIQPEISGCEKATHFEELQFSGGVTFYKLGCLDENFEPEAAMPNINFEHSSLAREISQLHNVKSPVPQEKSEFFEPFGSQSPVPVVDDLRCPWFKMTKTVINSPTGSYPLANDNKQGYHGSAQPEAKVLLEAKCLLKTSTASEKGIFKSSDNVDKLEDAHSSSPESSTVEKDAENGLFTPVRRELGSSEEVSSVKKVYPEVDDIQTYPEIRLVEKPVLLRSKQQYNRGAKFSDFSPTLHTPKVSFEMSAGGFATDVFKECLDESPEYSLARVVSLLGLALEKVKTKMVSVANQKCSEILVSAAEEINTQLLNVESQLQTDLEKLTSIKTTKRKHMETRLQEQQEQLKDMHEKFKEEIAHYLQDCRGIMEGLETQNFELQGAVERQKALHRKLLSQTETAVETHLIDAQRQMMIVRKLGSQKMKQLKVSIAECLKDGISR